MKLRKKTSIIVIAFIILSALIPFKNLHADTLSDKETEALCRKKISLDPSDYTAITQLGQIYWEKGKRKAAIKLFRKAVKIEPDYPIAHFFLGKAYFFEKKPGKGLAEFNIFRKKMDMLKLTDEETIDLYVSLLHRICYVYSTQKLYKEVLDVCRKIIKLKPHDQKAHYNMAVCYYVSYRNRPRAYSELQRVIEIAPHTRIADMARYYIDYMRRNPDARIIGDFGFLKEE